MRKLTVSTNWPTVAEKPDRKALNGCVKKCFVSNCIPYISLQTYAPCRRDLG